MDSGEFWTLVVTAIVSMATSGSLVSLLNWRSNQNKINAESKKVEAETELTEVEAGSKHTEADHSTIDQLMKVNDMYSTRVESLDAKVAELERREMERRSSEVDLEIRVKRLEAELAITVQTVHNRDQTIANLELALEECRAIVSSQQNRADYYYGE